MLKKLILSCLLIMSFGYVKAQSSLDNSSSHVYFAQGNFEFSENQDLESLSTHLALNSNIDVFRFDIEHNLFIVFTKDIQEFNKTVLLSWFGSYLTNISCTQIGIQGVDERNVFPFQNCND